jgi:DNA modification methylase
MIRDRIRDLRRVRAGDLRPNPRNFRRHPPAQREVLKAVLQDVGYADALLVREAEDGQLDVIDGHLRADMDPEQIVPVLVLDVSAAEADKIMLTHDPIAALAETDRELLDAVSQSVTWDDPAVRKMLDELSRQAGLDEPAAVIEDEVPELQTDPAQIITRPGDLIIMGKHRLVCGDATNAEDVAIALGKRKPLLMITDPPYGVSYDPKWRLDQGLNKIHQTRAEGKVTNDGQADWRQAYALFPGAIAYVWHASLHTDAFMGSMKAAGFEVRSIIIWTKPSLVIGRGHYHWQHEPCLYAVRKGKQAAWAGDRKQSTVWSIANMHRTQGKVDDGKTAHGTQKPVECMARPMRHHGNTTDGVYDPFAGSGTTLIAGEQYGREVTAIEIDPAYCDLIVARWEKFTGGTAERI